MMLSVRDLDVDYEDEPVLRGLNLEAAADEVVAVLGPSGCGKTTLLRSIAGLEKPQSGEIWLEGRSLAGVPSHQRGVGMMFQNFALFPHLSVIDNVRFGLQMQHMDPAGANARAAELLELVGLTGFEHRDVTSLSGGEQQRVALARSLAPRPRLLMLDEPLGSLDAALRERLTIELRDIFRRVGLTALYVTHDQREALAISDRIAVLREGRVEQVGMPEEIYRAPASEFVAGFLGLGNILPVDVLVRWIPELQPELAAELALLHPEGITLGRGELPLPPAQVVDLAFLGDVYRITLEIEGIRLTARTPLRDYLESPAQPGQTINAFIDRDWVRPLRAS